MVCCVKQLELNKTSPNQLAFMKKQHLLVIGLSLTGLSQAYAQPLFTQITNGAIVSDLGQFAVPTWADFGNRGLLDLLIANYGGPNVLYQNNGDGTFTNITVGTPVQYVPYQSGAPVADYDNDGFLDMAVIAGADAPTMQSNLLYHNNGDGTFASVSGGGLTNFLGFFRTGAWVDYDNDGFVDLFLAQADANDIGGTSLLLHNNGDGTFSSVTNATVSDVVRASSLAWADYDKDGFADLIIGSDGSAFLDHCYMYHNNGHGSFTRILTNSVATDSWNDGAWTPTWGDYDNDGLPELFVAGMTGGNRLYHNDGNGAFTGVTLGAMLQAPSGGGSRACGWGDYDNDGYLDLFVASYNAPSRLFHNNGDGTFEQVCNGVLDDEANGGIYCQTCSWVDYDNDGFLDLFVTRFPENGVTSNLLYHNNGNSNAWLKVQLVGTVANRSAIGAKVRVHATIGGKSFWQLREITTGGGRWVQPLVAHFGLGNATNVDTMRIEWPSGTVQEFQNVAPKQILTITEPPRLNAAMRNSVPQFSLHGGRGLQYNIQTSADLTSWSTIGSVVVTNMSGLVQIVDTNTSSTAHGFYRAVSR